MPKRGYSAGQIIGMLREAEVFNGQGQSAEQICPGFGGTPTTYYRWRKEYGGLKVSQARRLKELEKENELNGEIFYTLKGAGC